MGKNIQIRKTLDAILNNLKKDDIVAITVNGTEVRSRTLPIDCDLHLSVTLLTKPNTDDLTGAQCKQILASRGLQTEALQKEDTEF